MAVEVVDRVLVARKATESRRDSGFFTRSMSRVKMVFQRGGFVITIIVGYHA